mmetsp:Transcript_4382/g.15164  ORF Transcript_4382/g.15164 Transcript_4382/m.15164 type:complete len:151 (+) Transcript_4382:212-664(+)
MTGKMMKRKDADFERALGAEKEEEKTKKKKSGSGEGNGGGASLLRASREQVLNAMRKKKKKKRRRRVATLASFSIPTYLDNPRIGSSKVLSFRTGLKTIATVEVQKQLNLECLLPSRLNSKKLRDAWRESTVNLRDDPHVRAKSTQSACL